MNRMQRHAESVPLSLKKIQISTEFRRNFATVKSKGGKTILFSSWVKARVALHLSHLPSGVAVLQGAGRGHTDFEYLAVKISC